VGGGEKEGGAKGRQARGGGGGRGMTNVGGEHEQMHEHAKEDECLYGIARDSENLGFVSAVLVRKN